MLLVELQRQDDLNKRESRSKETRSDSVPLLTVYENFLKECKICFHFYQDKASKQPKWRDLTGSEKLRLFAKINISVLFPTIPNSANVQKLWADFLQLYKSLTSTTPVNHTEFQKDAAKWHRLFISVYQSKNVTPYTHLLSSHISKFLEKYKTIAPFSQQGLEKLNDEITKYYFRSTNHHDKDSLQQILLKLNRLEKLEDSGYACQKLQHVCKTCKQIGHNARCCKAKE